MSFPAGWTQQNRQEWTREVEPTAAALAYALMTLPAATIMSFRSNYYGDQDQITRITYIPYDNEAVLS